RSGARARGGFPGACGEALRARPIAPCARPERPLRRRVARVQLGAFLLPPEARRPVLALDPYSVRDEGERMVPAGEQEELEELLRGPVRRQLLPEPLGDGGAIVQLVDEPDEERIPR